MKRKKWIKMLILVLVFSLFASGCETKKKREEIARAEYIEEYLKELGRMNAIINADVPSEDDYKMKWFRDTVLLPDGETTVSLYEMDSRIYAYNIIENKNLSLTGEQIVSLYSYPDEAIQTEFDSFCNWFSQNGTTKYRSYYDGLIAGCRLYKDQTGEQFADKDFNEFTAQEEFELAQWIKENPDYDLASEDIDYHRLLGYLEVDDLPPAPPAEAYTIIVPGHG